jgi:hypothetical protein
MLVSGLRFAPVLRWPNDYDMRHEAVVCWPPSRKAVAVESGGAYGDCRKLA